MMNDFNSLVENTVAGQLGAQQLQIIQLSAQVQVLQAQVTALQPKQEGSDSGKDTAATVPSA